MNQPQMNIRPIRHQTPFQQQQNQPALPLQFPLILEQPNIQSAIRQFLTQKMPHEKIYQVLRERVPTFHQVSYSHFMHYIQRYYQQQHFQLQQYGMRPNAQQFLQSQQQRPLQQQANARPGLQQNQQSFTHIDPLSQFHPNQTLNQQLIQQQQQQLLLQRQQQPPLKQTGSDVVAGQLQNIFKKDLLVKCKEDDETLLFFSFREQLVQPDAYSKELIYVTQSHKMDFRNVQKIQDMTLILFSSIGHNGNIILIAGCLAVLEKNKPEVQFDWALKEYLNQGFPMPIKVLIDFGSKQVQSSVQSVWAQAQLRISGFSLINHITTIMKQKYEYTILNKIFENQDCQRVSQVIRVFEYLSCLEYKKELLNENFENKVQIPEEEHKYYRSFQKIREKTSEYVMIKILQAYYEALNMDIQVKVFKNQVQKILVDGIEVTYDQKFLLARDPLKMNARLIRLMLHKNEFSHNIVLQRIDDRWKTTRLLKYSTILYPRKPIKKLLEMKESLQHYDREQVTQLVKLYKENGGENPEDSTKGSIREDKKHKRSKSQIVLYTNQNTQTSVLEIFLYMMWNLKQKKLVDLKTLFKLDYKDEMQKLFEMFDNRVFEDSISYIQKNLQKAFMLGNYGKNLELLFAELTTPSKFQFSIESKGKCDICENQLQYQEPYLSQQLITISKLQLDQNNNSLSKALENKLRSKIQATCKTCNKTTLQVTRHIKPLNNSDTMPSLLLIMFDIQDEKSVRYQIDQRFSLEYLDSKRKTDQADYQIEFIVILKKSHHYTLYYNDPVYHSTGSNDKISSEDTSSNNAQEKSDTNKVKDSTIKQNSKKQNKILKQNGWFYYDSREGAAFSVSQNKIEKVFDGVKKSQRKEAPYLIGYKLID
eukprot:403376543